MAARGLVLQPAGSAADLYRGKLAAARHFFAWELAAVQPLHAPLRVADGAVLDCDPAWP